MVNVIAALELIRSFVEEGQWEGTLGRDVREKAKDHLKSALKDARILESKAFVRAIERAISPLDDADTTYEQFGVVHGDISSRIGDELHGLVFLFVQSEHARPYARDSPLFGVGVQAKFLWPPPTSRRAASALRWTAARPVHSD